MLQNSLRGVQRRRISNWRGYIYKLIRQVDESAYREMKESKEKEKENGPRRRSKKSNELETSASAPSKKEFNKGASEFVPGKPWKTPEDGSKTLRKDAAEFVPTVQAAPIFPPMMPPLPTAPGPFQDFTVPYMPASNGNGSGKTPLKPDAQEFFPGVSAWAGAMVMAKGKAKANAKPKVSSPGSNAPRKLMKAGPVPQPVSPGLLSAASRDADTAVGGTSPSQQSPVAPVSEAPAAKEVKLQTLSDGCQDTFTTTSIVPKLGKSKKCREMIGLLTTAECETILSKAQQLGFSPENRAAGSSSTCVATKDPWLAGQLWQRLSGVAPCIINGRKVLGIQEDMVLQHGARGSALADGSVALQLCLKSSQLQAGDAFILTAPEAGFGFKCVLQFIIQDNLKVKSETSWNKFNKVLCFFRKCVGPGRPNRLVARGVDALWRALLAQCCPGGPWPRWTGARASAENGGADFGGIGSLGVGDVATKSKTPEIEKMAEDWSSTSLLGWITYLCGCIVWKRMAERNEWLHSRIGA